MIAKYKLFVVGNSSPSPDDWSIWNEVAIVIAKDEAEARGLADVCSLGEVAEIPLDGPKLLIQESEPNWGDDL